MTELTSRCPDAATAIFNLPDLRVLETEILDFGQRGIHVESTVESGCPDCGVIGTRRDSRRLQRATFPSPVRWKSSGPSAGISATNQNARAGPSLKRLSRPRAWFELETSTPVPLPTDLTAEDIERVVFFDIADNETYTQGVLEQRIVDGLALLAFSGEGWRPKGIGDSVNASNLSRRKLGDVEFTNVDGRTAIALEAHGGQLSINYV